MQIPDNRRIRDRVYRYFRVGARESTFVRLVKDVRKVLGPKKAKILETSYFVDLGRYLPFRIFASDILPSMAKKK